MDSAAEISGFDIQPIIEQAPFEDPGVQSFFGEWCRINDGIRPEFVSRKKWEKKVGDENPLKEKRGGRKVLHIPKDLKLWEMVDVMEAVDRDTFAENPEKQTAKKELLELGDMFENAGIYIAQRLDSIDRGKGIAEDLAVQFYDYGQSLTTGKKPDSKSTIEKLDQMSIPQAETEKVDRWLAGDELYATKRAQLDRILASYPTQGAQLFEDTRRDVLARYFRVAEKSFERQQKTDPGRPTRTDAPSLKPWESFTPLHTAFIDKAKGQIQRAVEAPRRELEASVFRRGMEQLNAKIPFDKLPEHVKDAALDWQSGEKTLREALHIDNAKEYFDQLRRNGNLEELAEAETSFAHYVQAVVGSYPFTSGANHPSEMIATQQINCVGASMLAGSFLSEVGINYLVGDIPRHSILFLTTSTGQVEYIDVLNRADHIVTDDLIAGTKADGSEITVADLVNLAKNEDEASIRFSLSSEGYKEFLELGVERDHSIAVFRPEVGHLTQVLSNIGPDLRRSNHSAAAINALQHAIQLDPDSYPAYLNLGVALHNIGENRQAIEAYRKAIALEPTIPEAYYNLAVVSNSNVRSEIFEKFIELADPKIDSKRIDLAKREIAYLAKYKR